MSQATKEGSAFVSWSSADPRIAPLAEAFQNWMTEIFSTRLKFFYSKEISFGENSIEVIYEALEKASFGFLFLSQLTARSPWVVYEFGRLYPLTKERRVIPILFDLRPEELKKICPPMERLQAASLLDTHDILKLVKELCDELGLKESEKLHIRAKAGLSVSNLSNAISELTLERVLLPERFAGYVAYNNRIDMSRNFNMPKIFDIFTDDLFLVGINHAYLLNLMSSKERLEALITSLHQNKKRKVRILISNLWDEKIEYTYTFMQRGGRSEVTGLTESLFNNKSDYYIGKVVQTYCDKNSYDYEDIRNRFRIKSIRMLLDTFWFVDVDIEGERGDMMLLPMTAEHGIDRAAFYMNAKTHFSLIQYYYDLCKQGWGAANDAVWPA